MTEDTKKIMDRIRRIHNMLDWLMLEGLFQTINAMFEELNPEALDENDRVAYLTASLPAASKFPARSAFLGHCIRLDGAELYKGLEVKKEFMTNKELYGDEDG